MLGVPKALASFASAGAGGVSAGIGGSARDRAVSSGLYRLCGVTASALLRLDPRPALRDLLELVQLNAPRAAWTCCRPHLGQTPLRMARL